MEITLATKDDVDGILPLQSQIYRIQQIPKVAAKIVEELIEANYADVLVAKIDGKVVGTGTVFYLPIPAHGKPYAFLEGIVVDNNFRGQGIGKNLCERIIELAKKKSCYKIVFMSGMDRADIHNFYENLGFKKWGFEFRMDLD